MLLTALVYGLLIAAEALILFAIFGRPKPAHARWKPEYATLSQQEQAWYKQAQVNPAAQARLGIGFKGCCEFADVVEAEFRYDAASDSWYYMREGTSEWKLIPRDIIHYEGDAPGGRATLFIWQGLELCFWPPNLGG